MTPIPEHTLIAGWVGKCHVEGWDPAAVFIHLYTRGGVHTLMTPQGHKRYQTCRGLFYTRIRRPERKPAPPPGKSPAFSAGKAAGNGHPLETGETPSPRIESAPSLGSSPSDNWCSWCDCYHPKEQPCMIRQTQH